MPTEDASPEVTVRMFGLLHTLRRERDLPTTVTVRVPDAGCPASEVATMLDLPLDQIEGVFVNRTVYDVEHPVMPGDRVAFVPYGTPGPHRVFLGLYRAGKHPDAED